MGPWNRLLAGAALSLGLLIGCGGDEVDPAPPGETTPPVDDGGTQVDPIPADWSAPDCGEEGDLDGVMDYAGGKVRLCVRESEVRLWGLTGAGVPDPSFTKGQAEVRFTPEGGSEQMVSGIILKGDAAAGFATRMLGHGGAAVAGAVVVIGDEEVRLR